MELLREKNVATYVYFPLVDADGDIVTGAGALDSQIDTWANGTAPNGFVACTNEATEQGSTGVYALSLTQAEMNNDYIYISIASTSAKKQHILIRTMSYADYKATGFSTHSAADIWTAGSRELSTPASYKADVSSLALEASVQAVPTTSEIDTALSTTHGSGNWEGGGAAPTVSEINTELTTQHGSGAWTSANVASLALEASVQGLNDITAADIWAASGRTLSTPNDYKADVSGLATSSALATAQTDLDNPDQYKADVSGLAPANEYDSEIAAIQADLTRLRGLNGEYLVAEYTFSGDDNITLEFWQYDNESNFNTHDKSTGLLGTWVINTTYSGGKPTVAKSKKLT